MNHDAQQIKQAACGRWPEILFAVAGIDLGLLDGKHHPCPKCGGKDRFRMIDQEAGAVLCNQCFGERNGDGIAAIQWARKCDFRTAVQLLAKHLGLDGSTDNSGYSSGKSQIVATYDYRGEDGRLLKQVCRLEPKGFRQRAPKKDGEWSWSVKGIPETLYRLPELRNADPSDPVWIPEGENDVDRLRGLHLRCVATCNAGGVGKWQSEFAQYFAGRNVVVLADNDDPGRKHADQVAANLQGVAASVKVVELPGLPPKGDVSDWLNAGHTLGDLWKITVDTPEWKPTEVPREISTDTAIVLARDYLTQQPPEVEVIIPGLLDQGDKFFIVGQSKLGKSFFTLQMALCLASRKPFLNWTLNNEHKVLLIQFELKPAKYWQRVRNVASACEITADDIGDRLHILNLRGKHFSLDNVQSDGYDVVIFDPFYKILDHEEADEVSAKDIARVLSKLDTLAERGPAVGIVHHGTKGRIGDKQVIDRASGSGVIARDFDGMFTLSPHRDHSGEWLVLDTVLRNYRCPEAKTIEFRGCAFVVREDVPPEAQTSQTVNRARQAGTSVVELAAIVKGWVTRDTRTEGLKDRIKDEFSVGEKKAQAVLRQLEEWGFKRRKANSFPAYGLIRPPDPESSVQDISPVQGVLPWESQTPQTPQTS